MSKTITLKIDGKEVKVPEGTNLIDAAEAAGVHIPNLCYLKGMRGIGACRLCLVEIEGMKAPMIACTTKAKDGMVVNTNTERVREIRRFVIDLILSMHPLDCMTCTKAGACNLQRYAYDFELKESSFTRKRFGHPVDEANPFIKRDPDYCILCGRCVRVCKEQNTNVLDFMGRGVGARVITAMDRPLQESGCTFCGSCVDACPVNALLEADRWRKGREWECEKRKSVCLLCGNGCDIIASVKDGSVIKINSGAPDGSVLKYICAIGRFGFDALTSDIRLTTPLKREDGELKETTWKDALKIVAEMLKKSGKDSGIISTGSILNQDAFVLSKFGSDVVKTKNIDTTVSMYADAESMRLSDTVNIDDVDLIILVGLNPSQWERVLPALDASIRKRVARGAKLITINSAETRISSVATIDIRADETLTLSQIFKSLISRGMKASKEMDSAVSDVVPTEQTEKVAELLCESKEPVILCSPSLFKASKNISLLTTLKVVAVAFEANARGVVALGLTTEGKTYKEMIGKTQSDVKVLYVIGEIPLINERPEGIDFLIVQSSYLTGLARHADVVLPSATFLESKGTIIDYLGRVREIERVIDPPADVRQHKDIVIELSRVMGKPIKESAAEIKSAFEVSLNQKFTPFKKEQGLDIALDEFMELINQPVITSTRLLWLKEEHFNVPQNS
jgi:NADH dehydrogenase/NADH:ubiquinone oxidoreductase subunit G